MHQCSLVSAEKSKNQEDYTKNPTCLHSEKWDSGDSNSIPNNQLLTYPTSSQESPPSSESTGGASSKIVFYHSECRCIVLPNISIRNQILAVTDYSLQGEGVIISRRCLLPLQVLNTRGIPNGLSDPPSLTSSYIIEHSRSTTYGSHPLSHVTNAITTLVPNFRGLPRIQHRPFLHLPQPNEAQMDLMRQLVMESVLYVHRLAVVEFTTLISTRQDVRVSNQSTYVSGADNHYTDHLWLDVGNMSYEELLALEDHIGYVSTGLSEDAILMSLRHSKYFLLAVENSQTESCSICQENYMEEDELGTLDCGHGFHIACIKRWLTCKNSCPICKSTGLCILGPSLQQIDSL